MIESLELQVATTKGTGYDFAKPQFDWAHKLAFFKSQSKIEFKPGLNIVVGPNGSGKSTIISMLAQSLAAVQGGFSTVTEAWLGENVSKDGHSMIPALVRHDGCAINYFNAQHKIGLDGSHFDDDFFMQGLQNTLARGSAGQMVLQRLGYLLNMLTSTPDDDIKAMAKYTKALNAHNAKKKKRDNATRGSMARFERLGPPPDLPGSLIRRNIDWRIKASQVNSVWAGKIHTAEKLMQASIEDTGVHTILMDEPDAHFSLEWQTRIWDTLVNKVDYSRFQIIVASHSPLVMNIKNANYISLEPGFVESAKVALLVAVNGFAVKKMPSDQAVETAEKPVKQPKPRATSSTRAAKTPAKRQKSAAAKDAETSPAKQ